MVCMLGVFFSLSLEMQMLCASAFVPAKKLVLSFVHFSAWNVYRLGKTHGDLFILWRNVNLLKPVHRSTTENRFLFTLIFDRVRNESYARAQNVLTFDGFFGDVKREPNICVYGCVAMATKLRSFDYTNCSYKFLPPPPSVMYFFLHYWLPPIIKNKKKMVEEKCQFSICIIKKLCARRSYENLVRSLGRKQQRIPRQQVEGTCFFLFAFI